MNYPSAEFNEAVSALCHGTATDEQVQRLAGLLRSSSTAQDVYLLAMELHARLASDNGLFFRKSPLALTGEYRSFDEAAATANGRTSLQRQGRRNRRWWVAIAATAAVFLVCLTTWRLLPQKARISEASSVATTLLKADNVPPGTWRPGQPCALHRLDLPEGTVQLRIEESGVTLDVSAPADVRFITPMLVRVVRGQVTADVGQRGKGFCIETAQGRFVDLGTTFGVHANAQDVTDLVVFRGSVQVYPDTIGTPPLWTLAEGEAVRVSDDRTLARIPNIVSGPGPGPWSTRPPAPDQCVIAAVRDNLRSPHDRVFYQIIPGGFRENTQAYVGPQHIWKGRTPTGLPSYLLGADMVRTFPTDQDRKGLQITVQLSRPAMLYVLFETRPQQSQWREAGNIPEVPAWLEKSFHKVGDAVGLDDAGQLKADEPMLLKPGEGHLVTFDVWERKIEQPGEVTLGPPTGPEGWKNWMYGIAAQPLRSE